jgi:hypothetical protein
LKDSASKSIILTAFTTGAGKIKSQSTVQPSLTEPLEMSFLPTPIKMIYVATLPATLLKSTNWQSNRKNLE